MSLRPLLPFFALVLASYAGVAGGQRTPDGTPPQQDWMVHMASTNGSWSFVPDRIVLVPGGLVQLMVFGDGQFSLTLDDVPGADADIASTTGTVRTAELRAPAEPGAYAFHDKHHPEAGGVLVVAQPLGADSAGSAEDAGPVIGVVPGGYESRFAPSRLEVAAGDEVLFRANGTFGHNLRAVDGTFDAGDLLPGGEATFRAPIEPGEYAFECRFHAEQGMRGTLVVRDAAQESTTPADEADRRAPLMPAIVLGAILLAALAWHGGRHRLPPR